MHEKGACLIHALDRSPTKGPLRIHAETMRLARRTSTYMPSVIEMFWSYFGRTTCSVDATLIKRPEGFPRFPDYDPAPRSAPREMGILYHIFD
jgi:hypothetical protein